LSASSTPERVVLAATAAPSPDTGVRHDVYWRVTEPVIPGQPLQDDLDCDICIVGAGYTGLWIAHFLKSADPALDVQLLEASYAGAGASGHNDGFATCSIGAKSWRGIARRHGPEAATAVHGAVARSVVAIQRFADQHSLAIDAEPLGYYQVATNRRQDQLLKSGNALSARLTPEAKQPQLLDGAVIRARIGSPAIVSGIWRAGMLINPHKLARGLARTIRAGGAVIHEQTPVLSVDDDGRQAVLRTPAATVRARRVVLATNAWQGQFPQFRRRVIAQWHYALVTAPLSDSDLESLNWRGREGFIEMRRPGVFGRLTADNRILFGGGDVCDYHDVESDHVGTGTKRVERGLHHEFLRYFPMLDGLRVEYFHGGAMGVTPGGMARVGWLTDRLGYSYGYSGNGIGASHTVGRLVAAMLLGQESPDWARVFVRPAERRFAVRPAQVIAGKSKACVARAFRA
jgi:glycine/D-amino acid oxidase-like deaminating enzyme